MPTYRTFCCHNLPPEERLNSEYSEWLPYEECCWYASAIKNKMLPCFSYSTGDPSSLWGTYLGIIVFNYGTIYQLNTAVLMLTINAMNQSCLDLTWGTHAHFGRCSKKKKKMHSNLKGVKVHSLCCERFKSDLRVIRIFSMWISLWNVTNSSRVVAWYLTLVEVEWRRQNIDVILYRIFRTAVNTKHNTIHASLKSQIWFIGWNGCFSLFNYWILYYHTSYASDHLPLQCTKAVTFRRTEKFEGCIDDDYIGQSVVLSPENCGIITY